MKTKNRFFAPSLHLPLACALALSMLSGCGAEKNADVGVSITPQQPIAFDINRTIPDPYPNNDIDESIIINKNWFQFSLTFTNSSDKVLTIMAIKMKVKGAKNGEPTETIVTFDPGSFNDTARTSISELQPGTEATIGPFIAGDLAEVSTLRYSVEAEIKGWYGTHLVPLAPMTKVLNFSTQ